MQCPRCQQEIPAQTKFCPECGTPTSPSGSPAASYSEQQRALKESLTRESAMGEILRAIRNSPTDLTPVLESVAQNAARLCEAEDVSITRAESDGITILFSLGPAAAFRGQRFPTIRSATSRAISECRTIHVPDLLADPNYETRPEFRRFGWRSGLAVPLLRDGVAIGTITARRSAVRPFSDQQIKLLETFADQAVIAIENVRLFTELQEKNRALTQAHAQISESLEQQTATSEILRVISRSPTDVQPVFDAIVSTAVRLCGADHSVAARFDGELLHPLAFHGFSPEALELIKQSFPMRPTQDLVLGRVALSRSVVSVPDTLTDPGYSREFAVAGGWRSGMGVPMLRDRNLIGVIVVARTEPGAFPEQYVGLLKTFADQAVIAIENVRLFKQLEARNRDLTATSEILRVISSSPTDIQPVLETIVEHAGQVVGAVDAVVFLVEGNELVRMAHRGPVPIMEGRLRLPIDRDSLSGLALLECRTVHVEDILASQEFPRGRAIAERSGFRTAVSVPLVKEGVAIGTLVVRRAEVQAFTPEQISLLETFADQAVIAIENVRLFNETKEALERQTATSEILRVISSSPTDVQPVFDAIVESATRLCAASVGHLFQFDGELLSLVAQHNSAPEMDEVIQRFYPMRPSRGQVSGRAILNRTVVHIPDVFSDHEYRSDVAASVSWRSRIGIPLLREGNPIGVIVINRTEAGLFADSHIKLLQTFADQAVIAIENVRLFKELEARNRDLTVALDQQTATSEILRVISSSPTNVEPVFKTILANANTLCDASFSVLWLWDGEALKAVAHENVSPALAANLATARPRPHRRNPLGLSILEQTVIHVEDVLADPRFAPEDVPTYRLEGARSILSVPMVREGSLVGVINIWRREPRAFTDSQIELVKTFANQAVIAIENVRLFKELEARTQELTRSVDQLTALGEVGRAVSSTLDLETVLTTIVSRAVQLSGLDGGGVFEYEESTEELVPRASTDQGGMLALARRATRIRKGEGVLGRTALTLEAVQVPDISLPGAYEGRLRENLIESGVRALLAVPMVREGKLIGSLVVSRNTAGEFSPEIVDLLRTFAAQSALAIQNARLFHQLEVKSSELAAASQHKSEFLANMSHELRTPLNAIIGFSEVLKDRMFGDLNEKQEEYLKDIYSSGTHLLSLINDILDLSKIEAGRMELELTGFHLPTALDNALTLVRERAGRRNITLKMSVDERLGEVRADERKIRQVVLNLLSNAIKFTPEGGRIDVRAVPVDGAVEVSISDTGVGIAPEDQEAVFEEFRQVGTADKKAEGTGLGLTLCRKFIELHGGRIWVQSQVGVGSTFAFTVPVKR